MPAKHWVLPLFALTVLALGLTGRRELTKSNSSC
jgi:hypothetical protein